MNIYKKFRTDEKLETKGIELNYGDNSKGLPILIRIARAGGDNIQFTKTLEKRTKPFRRQLQLDTMDEKVAKKLMLEVYADSVILGWSGVEDADNNDIPFTRENCIKVMTDLPDLFADIQEQAGKAALFRIEVLEEDSKN